MTTGPLALIDTNVVVAALVLSHPHHNHSRDLLARLPINGLAVSAHTYAEAYAVLTRPAPAPFHLTASRAWTMLESLASVTQLIGLTHAQTFFAIRQFAGAGLLGSMIYDRLIGEAAVLAGLNAIVTWNVRHMAALFPDLNVTDPQGFLANRGLTD